MAKVELLAPAGSPETLRAVLAAGADAVYVGGAQFGARAYAKNFTEDELLDAIDYTHLCGKKLHLTVNTLLKTRELEEQLYGYLLPYYERGLDAVIVQDAGVFSFVKEYFPGLALHVSTQATVTGADGAQVWKDAGAARIVLARELSLEEIRDLHEKVDIELECFVHGALCYCYSGQCLFSSMLGGRSGNRGRCAQPCRLPYAVVDAAGDAGAYPYKGGAGRAARGGGAKKPAYQSGERYPLSPRDLCALDLLPELLAAGASSLKIEGRMKQTAYAAGVTEIYRKYVDLAERGGDYAVAESDRKRLLALGNRDGFTDGYLRGETGRAMISLSSPKHTAERSAAAAFPQRKRHVTGHLRCMVGEALALELTDEESGKRVCVTGGIVQEAKHAPVRAEELRQVLRQTGETGFVVDALTLDVADGCFVPKQFLKALRREAFGALREALLAGCRRKADGSPHEYDAPAASLKRKEASVWEDVLAVCDTPGQLRVCAGRDAVGTVALSLHSFFEQELPGALEGAVQVCRTTGKRLALALPAVLRAQTIRAYERQWACVEKLQKEEFFEGFLAGSYDALGFLRRMGAEHVMLNASLYTFSARAEAFFRDLGYEDQTLPLELNAGELRGLDTAHGILTVYGHAPFMVSAQCVNKTTSDCDGQGRRLYLSDRQGKRLPVKAYCGVCYNVIYNAVPTVLFDGAVRAAVERLSPGRLRMDFTVEDDAALGAVFDAYERAMRGEDTALADFTRGHFRRGVQ